MAATTDQIAYGTSTAITCTITSLGSSATTARTSTAIVNTTALYDDALVTVTVKSSSSAAANDKCCYIYIYGSEDGTNYSASSAEGVGTDGSITLDSPTNLRGPVVLNCPAVSTTYRIVFAIAGYFGGVMPRKWGIVVQNYTGQTLDASVGGATYTGITYTNT